MSEPTAITPGAAKRRQYLLLGGIVCLVIVAAIASAALTGARGSSERVEKPKLTSILAPGAQVDPRDAWRGQADAQLKAIEQKSREMSQRNTELESQNKTMLERLQKLEQSKLTQLPPPPIAVPPAPANFGPDRISADQTSLQQLPPPPPVRANPLPTPSATTGGGGQASSLGIVSIALADAPSAKGGKSAAEPSKGASSLPKDTRRYIPSGAFTRAILLGGLDAPTGGMSQRNPQPVLLRLMDNAVLPSFFRSRIKECFVVGAGYGDISSERAYIRTESLSCITKDGTAIDVPVKGYVTGEDGKAGMRGRLVSKQGQILANALMAGVASGIGHAFQQSATTVSVSPLGATSTVEPEKQLQAGVGMGVGRALDRLAQYYISLAEKVFPVIEVDAGRSVDVVLTQGVALQTSLDAQAGDQDEFPQLANRSQRLNRSNDDDE